MTGNLLRGGINRVFGENKPAIRGCMTQKARAYVDSENLYVINEIGGINSNVDLPSSYLLDKSEILDNNSNTIGYHRAGNQKNTAAEVKSTAEEVTQSQSVQNVNSGYMFSGKGNDKSVANEKNGWVFGSTLGYGSSYGKPNDGYPDYSFASRWTEIQSKVEPTTDVPVAMPTSEQQTEQSIRFCNNSLNSEEQSIYGMPFQVLGGKSPIELNDNGFLDQASGDPSPHSSQYTFGVNLVDQSARQAMVGGGTQYKEQEPQDWRLNGDFGSGEHFVTERSLDGSQAGYETLHDVLQEFGGWQGIQSAVEDKMDAAFSIAGSFASEWGEAYGETLLKKVPFPPYIKVAITVGFLAKKVYDVAKGVEDKRTALLNSLDGKVSEQEAQAIADDKVKDWLSEEIGKVVIEEGLDAVLDSLPMDTRSKRELSGVFLREARKTAIIQAWKTFVQEAETGRWERDITR